MSFDSDNIELIVFTGTEPVMDDARQEAVNSFGAWKQRNHTIMQVLHCSLDSKVIGDLCVYEIRFMYINGG